MFEKIEKTLKDDSGAKILGIKGAMIVAIVFFILGAGCGFYVGHTWFERVTKVEVPTTQTVKVNEGAVAQITADYVKGELAKFAKPGSQTSTTNYFTTTSTTANGTGGTTTSTVTLPDVEYTQQKADMKVGFKFDQFNVLANGKPISFTKDENEDFMFQKNMLNWNIGVKVNADITVPQEKPRPQFGPYVTTRSAGVAVSAPDNKGNNKLFTITTPWRDRKENSSTLENVEVGFAVMKKF